MLAIELTEAHKRGRHVVAIACCSITGLRSFELVSRRLVLRSFHQPVTPVVKDQAEQLLVSQTLSVLLQAPKATRGVRCIAGLVEDEEGKRDVGTAAYVPDGV